MILPSGHTGLRNQFLQSCMQTLVQKSSQALPPQRAHTMPFWKPRAISTDVPTYLHGTFGCLWQKAIRASSTPHLSFTIPSLFVSASFRSQYFIDMETERRTDQTLKEVSFHLFVASQLASFLEFGLTKPASFLEFGLTHPASFHLFSSLASHTGVNLV